MKFIKMQGLGNDFVVIVGPMEPSSSLINAICDRRKGVGADGVIATALSTLGIGTAGLLDTGTGDGDIPLLGWFFKKVVRETTEKEVARIEKTYKIETDTYTDSDGCTYNSLVKANL
ncbi:MAG: hypothetical protein IIB04_06975 [Acidobacteria bacterium]|nr:hypothetical protein [Acidobacteriota bacterium]